MELGFAVLSLQDAAAWATSLQEAQLAAEATDFDLIRARLRGAGRLNRTECERLNPLAPPFQASKRGSMVWGRVFCGLKIINHHKRTPKLG